ncbi:GyrI-like domain-containing protein [Brevibacillus sp. TJ4]|uniref:GyrI-like domain-containing protein n=1 Tax=Brevibacillus sp. TJ4 TaxID=3234853 RepID=UPI003BA3CE97
MEGNIVRVPQKHFIGISFSGTFPMLLEEMPKQWAHFLTRQKEIPLVVDADVRYDISDENRTYKMHTEYIAVEVERFETIPEKMVALTIPARTYAQFTHTGPMSEVQHTYTRLFQWLEEQRIQVDWNTLRMERYDARYIPSHHEAARQENSYEIYIPLAQAELDQTD